MTQPVDAELAALLQSCAVCRPWAEQDEGPYRRDDQPLRRDVTEGRDGAALQLGIRVAGLLDGTVEIWHCDALGRYSGFPPPAPAPRTEYLPDETFLRGRQPTDAAGMVEFRTIYPGWYPGRTVHIHLVVHVGGASLITQLYFPEEVTDEVHARPPYAERPRRDTVNHGDEIFPTGGEPAVLDVVPVGDGYCAAICLVLP